MRKLLPVIILAAITVSTVEAEISINTVYADHSGFSIMQFYGHGLTGYGTLRPALSTISDTDLPISIRGLDIGGPTASFDEDNNYASRTALNYTVVSSEDIVAFVITMLLVDM